MSRIPDPTIRYSPTRKRYSIVTVGGEYDVTFDIKNIVRSESKGLKQENTKLKQQLATAVEALERICTFNNEDLGLGKQWEQGYLTCHNEKAYTAQQALKDIKQK